MMALIRLLTLWSICVASVAAQLVFMPQNDVQPLSENSNAIPVDLSTLADNQAFGKGPGDARYDDIGSASSVSLLGRS